VISHLETEIIGYAEYNGENTTVILISIYDKSTTASISEKELKEFISKINLT